MQPMEFGIFNAACLLPKYRSLHGESAEHDRIMDEVAFIVAADKAGFKYTWASEHHFLTDYSHLSASESFLAFVAAKTSNIHIGSGIFNITPPVNHPARIAERVAMLDHLSEGRFEFGTGRGSSTTEQRGFGIDDPDLTQVAIGAFNEWLHDEWRYDYEGRIFATPIVNPCVLDQGIADLERVIERGAKAVLLRPAPVSGLRGVRSPFLPEFDPFWARIQESGLLVALHASDSGYQRYLNTWEGSGGAEYVAFRPKTFLASAICHGMLTRFPGVHLISVENGGSWVGHLVRNLELSYKKMPQEFPEHPRDVFERNVWINPFWEDSVTGLIDLIGAERVCFGSDFPHPEGLDEPLAWHKEVAGLPTKDVERVMSTNLAHLLAA